MERCKCGVTVPVWRNRCKVCDDVHVVVQYADSILWQAWEPIVADGTRRRIESVAPVQRRSGGKTMRKAGFRHK